MNRDLLEKVISDSGIPKTVIAERMGMPYPRFISKVDGRSQWKVSEAERFCDAINLSKSLKTKIFF